VAVTRLVTVFVVRMSRGGQVARELLGERFSGGAFGHSDASRSRCWYRTNT
jgi:hypothetical protein